MAFNDNIFDMQALILAGGKGTRLRPLTVYTPKPIVPVLNRPFLLFQLEILRKANITDVILSLNYQPDKIEQLLGDGSDYGIKLRYITEPQPLGTAGAFKYAENLISSPTVVLNGDILTNVDISQVINQHQQNNAQATIVLTPVENPTAYGLVETDENRKVLRFREKPTPEEVETLTTKNINAGIYLLQPEVLELIPKGENCSFEYQVFPSLLEHQKNFQAFILEKEYWLDIGTPQNYLKAHQDFLKQKVSGFDIKPSNNYDFAHTAIIDEQSLIAEGCIIKPNAKIINSVIGKGVQIEEKAVIENSVIWPHTKISNSSVVKDSVIARSCHIGKHCSIGSGTVLGDKTSLADYSKISF